MALTPQHVRNKLFTSVRLRQGYDEDEVDAFLDEVEAEFTRLAKDNEELRRQLATARAGGSPPAGQLASEA
ncbi:MAG TPA: DivIVA domain-containing protein, partial [Mycobacteriales bacterium]